MLGSIPDQGLIKRHEWLFTSDFWFYMNLPLRDELVSLFVFAESILFEKINWKFSNKNFMQYNAGILSSEPPPPSYLPSLGGGSLKN